MAKKPESREIVDQRTGEVLPASMLADMEQNAGKQQSFRQDDLIIPRINILQDLSAQVKERNPEYVPGAKPGMVYNTVLNSISPSIRFIPAKYNVRYVAWRPRPIGGLIDQNVPEASLEDFQKEGFSKWVGMMRVQGHDNPVAVEVIETPEWAGIAVDGEGRVSPCIISFPSTKGKAARKINTTIEMTEVNGSNGPFVPPAFYHSFTLGTALEVSGENEFFSWTVTHDGFCTDTTLIAKAKKLYDQIKSGEAVAADIEG